MEGRGHCVAALLLMLQVAISAQLFVSFFMKCGVFVRDEGVVITATRLCLPGRDGEEECSPVSSHIAVCEVLAICVYAPLPLTLFAALGYLYGVYLSDSNMLRFSLVTQALAAVMMFAGVVVTIGGHWHLIRLPGLTVTFYLSVCACVEMAVAAILCWVSMHILASRKELTESFV